MKMASTDGEWGRGYRGNADKFAGADLELNALGRISSTSAKSCDGYARCGIAKGQRPVGGVGRCPFLIWALAFVAPQTFANTLSLLRRATCRQRILF